jgi:hypothetical protein
VRAEKRRGARVGRKKKKMIQHKEEEEDLKEIKRDHSYDVIGQ